MSIDQAADICPVILKMAFLWSYISNWSLMSFLHKDKRKIIEEHQSYYPLTGIWNRWDESAYWVSSASEQLRWMMSVIYKKILYNNNTLYFHPLIIYHITCLPICCNLFFPLCLYVCFFLFCFCFCFFFFLMLRLLVHGWCCLLISYCASVDSVRRKLIKKGITDIMNEQA